MLPLKQQAENGKLRAKCNVRCSWLGLKCTRQKKIKKTKRGTPHWKKKSMSRWISCCQSSGFILSKFSPNIFCSNWDHLTTLNNQSSHAPLAFAILQDFQVPSLSIPHKHGPSWSHADGGYVGHLFESVLLSIVCMIDREEKKCNKYDIEGSLTRNATFWHSAGDRTHSGMAYHNSHRRKGSWCLHQRWSQFSSKLNNRCRIATSPPSGWSQLQEPRWGLQRVFSPWCYKTSA